VSLSLLSIPVSGRSGPPVVLTPHATFRVRGRLHDSAQVHFGIAVSYGNGEFAGMFRGDLLKKQPVSKIDDKKSLRSSINSVTLPLIHVFVINKTRWHASLMGSISIGYGYLQIRGSSSGLMVHEVELIPGEINEHHPEISLSTDACS